MNSAYLTFTDEERDRFIGLCERLFLANEGSNYPEHQRTWHVSVNECSDGISKELLAETDIPGHDEPYGVAVFAEINEQFPLHILEGCVRQAEDNRC